MRKGFILFCLIIASSSLLVEIVHNFEKTKKIYSLFYPNENISTDTLTNLTYLNWGGGWKNTTTVYKGNLLKKKLKNVRLDVRPDPHLDSIPVWYFKLSKSIIYRRTKNFPSPSDFDYFSNEWFSTILIIVYLPLLIYYLKLRKK